MDLYPSIDLLAGKVVRLLRGDYGAETVYNDDAVAVARGFERDGARWIHVVDLDAARDGGDANLGVIEAICANVSARVQSGGRVAVGLDARSRDVAIHGWTDATGLDLVDLARRFGAIPGVGALVVTGINSDGTLEGPEIGPLREVLAAVATPLIASGGVGSLDDLRALAAVNENGRGFAGSIVGRAIYEGRVSVAEGILACSQSA